MKLFKDVDDNQFWLLCWSLAAPTVILIISIFALATAYEDKLIHDLVVDGHNPLELACVFGADNRGVAAACLLMGQARANEVTGTDTK